MQLHSACREKLIESVARGLQEVRLENHYLLDYSSFRSLDSCSLSLPSKVQEQVSNWISPTPLRDFSYNFVIENRISYIELLDEYSEEDFPVLLPEVADTVQMAVQIVDSFITLPWEYTVVLPFVSTAGFDFPYKHLPLLSELRIKKSSELRFTFPKQPDPFLLTELLKPATDWSTDRLYLEATLKGYIGLGPTETLEQFYHQARTVAGLGLAVNVFNRSISRYPEVYPHGQALLSRPLYVYRTNEGSEAKGKTLYVPDRIGPLNQLELRPSNFKKILLLPIAFGESDECSRLREAGQWYFASTTERNEIFEFVEAVVVLEILFNDKATAKTIGVEKLISNRCAYLIAQSTTERHEIVKTIEAIYEVRSNIVHRGKSRLSKTERDSLIQARALGSYSILKELGMIFRSQEQRKETTSDSQEEG